VLGATSYNLYLATVPGVTKSNYASLAGGQRIAGVSPPYTLTLPSNQSYSFSVTTVDGTGEGPSSRVASTTLVGPLTWQSVGGLSSTAFYSVAADPSNRLLAYAGAGGSVYRSTNGGTTWTQTLTQATTGEARIAALAVAGSNVFANGMSQATLWKSINNGASFTDITPSGTTGFGELDGSLAIDPTDVNTIYAGDFKLQAKTLTDSLVIKSIDGGANWDLTPEGSGIGDEIHAYFLAIDPNDHLTLYAGGSGTPNIARSTDGAASWSDIPISGNTGGVQSIAVDPNNSNTVYATTRDLGVYKSTDGGATWTAKNNGLTGVGTSSLTGFNSILIDPQDSNYLHLGAGNGYWYSIDGAEDWTAANNGFGGSPAYIYGLALTPARRLIAGTGSGLFMLSIGPAPAITTVSPNLDNVAGGTSVTITGSGFQPSATVTFGGTAATNVVVVSDTTITATTPAHSPGTIDVVVTNLDGRSGTLTAGFTYTNTPLAPANVTATAQTATSILVSWSASATATSYQVFRRDNSGAFNEIGTPTGTSFPDTVTAGTAHLYRVRAVNGSGASGDSAYDLATAVMFTDASLVAGTTTVKALHLTQLQAAVNAVRQLVTGLGNATFSDPNPSGVVIRAADILELRNALDAALGPLGRGTGGYTDSSLSGVPVKAVHFQQIRDRVK